MKMKRIGMRKAERTKMMKWGPGGLADRPADRLSAVWQLNLLAIENTGDLRKGLGSVGAVV